MFCVDSSWIPVDSGWNPLEFLEFRGIPGFRPESAESGRNQWRNGKYCYVCTIIGCLFGDQQQQFPNIRLTGLEDNVTGPGKRRQWVSIGLVLRTSCRCRYCGAGLWFLCGSSLQVKINRWSDVGIVITLHWCHRLEAWYVVLLVLHVERLIHCVFMKSLAL